MKDLLQLPWILDVRKYEAQINTNHGYEVASIELPTQSESERLAFIVRSCNSHDALLDTCRAVYKALDEWATERKPTLEELVSLRDQAKTAITLAEKL